MSRWEAWLLTLFWFVIVPVLLVLCLPYAMCDHLCRAH